MYGGSIGERRLRVAGLAKVVSIGQRWRTGGVGELVGRKRETLIGVCTCQALQNL